MSESPVWVVDAYSQIFRWYHAMPSTFTAPDGRCVNALFGMGKFMFMLRERFTPGAGFFAFDRGGSKERLALLPEYKSNRPPMPEDLRCQIEPIEELIDGFGWKRLYAHGYEADDIIATLAQYYAEPGLRVVTSDKDIAQLVRDGAVQLVSPVKGGEFIVMGEEEVQTKYGVKPALIPDYLSLLGDSVDVISGVPGVGSKTAAQMVNAVGALEPFLENGAQSHPKFFEKLAPHKETILRNLKLIRLNCSVPGILSEVPVPPEPDTDKLARLFEKYNLRSLLKSLEAKPREAEKPPSPPAVPPAPTSPPQVQDDLFAGMF